MTPYDVAMMCADICEEIPLGHVTQAANHIRKYAQTLQGGMPTAEEIAYARARGLAHPELPDAYCISREDGSCVGGTFAGLPPCMHE